MANFRKTTKQGSRTISQGPGGYGGTTTSYSAGSTMKDGRGTRRTVTTKSNGQRYIRTTEGAGGGYYKTTQRSLNARRPKALKKAKSDNYNVNWKALDSDGESDPVMTFIVKWMFIFWGLAVLIEWVQGWFK